MIYFTLILDISIIIGIVVILKKKVTFVVNFMVIID